MKITFPNFKGNPSEFMRRLGYAFDRNVGKEQSFMRRLSGYDYPRFHAYTQINDSNFIIHLHLDQKKPSYAGVGHAHGGEYEGKIIEEETSRIVFVSK